MKPSLSRTLSSFLLVTAFSGVTLLVAEEKPKEEKKETPGFLFGWGTVPTDRADSRGGTSKGGPIAFSIGTETFNPATAEAVPRKTISALMKIVK